MRYLVSELCKWLTITETTKMSVMQKTDTKKVALSCAAPKERETRGQERWQGMKALGDKNDNLNWIP